MKSYLYALLTLALHGGEQVRVPAAFYPRNRPHHSFCRKLSGSQIRSGGCGQEKKLPCPNRVRFYDGFLRSLVTIPLSNAGSAVRIAVLLYGYIVFI